MRVLASLVSGKPVGEVTRKTSVDTFDGQIGYDVQIILLSRKSVHLDSIFLSLSPPSLASICIMMAMSETQDIWTFRRNYPVQMPEPRNCPG